MHVYTSMYVCLYSFSGGPICCLKKSYDHSDRCSVVWKGLLNKKVKKKFFKKEEKKGGLET